jgi:hypothetical protein
MDEYSASLTKKNVSVFFFQIADIVDLHYLYMIMGLGLGCLTPLSTIYQLYRGTGRVPGRKPLTCLKSLTNFFIT